MKKVIATIFLSYCIFFPVIKSQGQSAITQEGEFGIGIGAAHYFGDLNPRLRLNRPKFASSIFYRKNFGNYIALRVSASYAQLGYSDKYNTDNSFMFHRNLSFNTNVWEFAVQGDFNFFRFMPGDKDFSFTPYITLGLGAFSYDPYAYLNGQKYYLRPLGTEGQGSPLYPNRKPYGSVAACIPIGAGVKYSFNERINIGLEILYRVTTTDYIDDVSKTYVSPAAFPPNANGSPSAALLLSDRSYELGPPIGILGRQRGSGNQKDSYVTGLIYVSFNLQNYKCPSAD